MADPKTTREGGVPCKYSSTVIIIVSIRRRTTNVTVKWRTRSCKLSVPGKCTKKAVDEPRIKAKCVTLTSVWKILRNRTHEKRRRGPLPAVFETFVAEMKDRNVRNRRQGVRASRWILLVVTIRAKARSNKVDQLGRDVSPLASPRCDPLRIFAHRLYYYSA